MTEKKSALSVNKVTFGYTKCEPNIVDATFEVATGEFIGIIGPNGGGKTTLLKLLMGFLSPWEGTISIFGKRPTKYPNGIAYVPQTLRFDRQFPLTVKDLVLEGRLSKLPWWGIFSKIDQEEALHALEQVGLLEYKDKPFGTLSGGQAQRALIARALASKQKILLLDEPTASVDAQAEEDIYALLQKIRKTHTILMVTHDIRAIIAQVERILCVQTSVSVMEPSTLCEHFAMGLYHFPLIQTPQSHFAKTPFSS